MKTEEELLAGAIPLTEDELLAGAIPVGGTEESAQPKPGIGAKILKPAVDTVVGMVGGVPDIVGMEWKKRDAETDLAAKVGSLMLRMFGVEDAPPVKLKAPAPQTTATEALRELLPEEARGESAETPMGRLAQEAATFAGQNVLGEGIVKMAGGTPRYVQAATDALAPAVASWAAGESPLGDNARMPAVLATELARGKVSDAAGHARDVVREMASGRETGSPLEVSRNLRSKRTVGKMIEEGLGPDAGDKLDVDIAARDEVRRLAPGFNPTTAAVTDNPKLAATQQAMESGLTGQGEGAARLPDMKNDLVLGRIDSNKAVSEAVKKILLPSGGDRANLMARARADLDAAAAAHEQALRNVEYELPPGTPIDELMERTRSRAIDGYEQGRKEASTLYESHLAEHGTKPVNGAGRIIDVTEEMTSLEPDLQSKRSQHIDPVLDEIHARFSKGVRDAVEERIALDGLDEDAAAAARTSGIYDKWAKEHVRIPYSEAVRLHQDLGRASNDAMRASQFDKARRLDATAASLRDIMETGVEDPQLMQGLQDANTFYRDFVNRFRVKGRPGLQARAHAPNSVDSPLVRSGDLLDKMFVPGEAGREVAHETARALERIDEQSGQWVRDPERLRDLQDAAFSKIIRDAHDPGSVVPGSEKRPLLPADAIAEARRKYESALSHPIYRDVDQRLRVLQDQRASLEARAAATGRDLGDYEKAIAAAMMGLDDDAAVKLFLRQPRVDRVKMIASLDPAAAAGLRKIVLDHIVGVATGKNETLGYGDARVLHPGTLLEQLRKPGVRDVFNDARHLSDAEKILKALSKSESARRNSTAGSQTQPLRAYQEALLGATKPRASSGARHYVGAAAGLGAGALLGPGVGMVARAATAAGTGLLADIAAGRIAKMRDVSKATLMRFMADAIADPEKARAMVRLIEGDQKAIPLIRHYLVAAGDLENREPSKSNGMRDPDVVGYPSTAYDDIPMDFGNFSDPQPAPPPKNAPQIKAAETKRIQAADRAVTKARTSAMDPPKVARDMRSKGISIKDITKRSEESRRKPFDDLVKRNSGNWQQMLAVLEALKPEELELVRDKAQPALDRLIEGERDDMAAADAMARADALFAPPAEEGAA